MQACLEIRSIDERHKQMARSDYNSENRYSGNHPDALATGDKRGKGTGRSGGSEFWLPSCENIGAFNYSNFDTDPNSGAGNCDDNEARRVAMARSKYSPENPYSASLIDTSANVAEGQYQVP